MRLFRNFFFCLLAISSLASCSPKLSPYTTNLEDHYRWSDEELKQIQFYPSQDIVLRREIRTGSSEIVSGKIKMENGREIEEIVIRSGTPGILLFKPEEKKFAVSFEEGGEKRYLIFGPDPKTGGSYKLLATKWVKKNGKGQIQYDGKDFYTYVNGRQGVARLMVDMRKVGKVQKSNRVAKGIKIK